MTQRPDDPAKKPPDDWAAIEISGNSNDNTFVNMRTRGGTGARISDSHGNRFIDWDHVGSGPVVKLINASRTSFENVTGYNLTDQQVMDLLTASKSGGKAGFMEKAMEFVGRAPVEKLESAWNLFEKLRNIGQ